MKDLARYRAASRHRGLNLPQHLLEPVLAEAAVATGLVDLRFSHEFVSLDQDETGVDAVVVDRHSGQELKIRSDYLVGADGANSRVLSQIGLAVRGERNLATNCYAWVKADLSRFVAHRPGVIYWPVDPAHPSFTLVKPWDEWTVGWAFREAPLSPAEVIEGIRSSVGDPHLDVEIKSIAQWSINHAAADTYSRGRVFCAGDAVHQHPPTNGLGSNTSIADGYNLAWKLQLALGGVAGPGLLASYGMERAPVGRQVVDRAFQSVQEVFSIAEVISLAADMHAEEKRTAIRSIQDPTDEGARKRQALADAMALMEYNFNAHGVELGYRYHGAAILESLDAVGRPEELEPGTTDDIVYVACTAPGEHLPHVFVERNGRLLSTVDLVGMGRFTVITGAAGEEWCQGADLARRTLGVRVDVCVIGSLHGYLDPMGEWERIANTGPHGCLLVRPDGHIAWRTKTVPDAGALVAAIAKVIDRPLGCVQDGDLGPARVSISTTA